MSAPAGNSTTYALMVASRKAIASGLAYRLALPSDFTVEYADVDDGFRLTLTNRAGLSFDIEYVAVGVGRGR